MEKWVVKKLLKSKKYKYFKFLLDKIHNIEGTIVECGLGKATSISIISYLNQGRRDIWGFDSFMGWPAPTKYDKSPRNPQKGERLASWLLKEQLLERLKERNVYYENIHIVSGFFSETLPHKYNGDKIALLHLDCDLYTSYQDALKLFPFLNKNGIIAFDEYKFDKMGGKIKWPGAVRAIDEFCSEHSLNIIKYEDNEFKRVYLKNG